jgi:hypothetical protein
VTITGLIIIIVMAVSLILALKWRGDKRLAMIFLGLLIAEVITGYSQYTLYATRCVYVPIEPSWNIRWSFSLYDSLEDLGALGEVSIIFTCIFFIFGLYELYAHHREEMREILRVVCPEGDDAK